MNADSAVHTPTHVKQVAYGGDTTTGEDLGQQPRTVGINGQQLTDGERLYTDSPLVTGYGLARTTSARSRGVETPLDSLRPTTQSATQSQT